MKTKEQIKGYILSQNWGRSFVSQMTSFRGMTLDAYLDEFSYNAISMAFPWSGAAEGANFWSDLSSVYRNWWES